MSKLPRIAIVVALVMAAFAVLAAVFGSILVLALGFVHIAAAIGIIRKKVWSAYGLSLYYAAQIALFPFLILRGGFHAGTAAVLASIGFSTALAALFFFAGRSLEGNGAPRGRALPWFLVVYRNGSPVNEPYAIHKSSYEDSFRDDFPSQTNTRLAGPAVEMLEKHVAGGEVIVPERSYFVLGDNRDFSLDSRYWGFVSFDDVVGEPTLIYDSKVQQAGESSSVLARQPTRWDRLFRAF